MKKCSSCEEYFELNKFVFDKKRGYYNSVCTPCAVTNYRKNHLMKKYGITLDKFDEMLEEQNYVCKICKCPQPNKKRLCVDHCHSTLEVRGLLCDHCNTALGKFKDNIELLEEAIKYLKNNR